MIKNSFKCSLTTAVYANRQVIDLVKPITLVIHDTDDSNWKFFCGDGKQIGNEKPVLVALEEILMIDPSVGEIATLPEGCIATRKYIGDNWKVTSNKGWTSGVNAR